METQDNVDELAEALTEAVQSGDVSSAQNIVEQLARSHLRLSIDVAETQNDQAKDIPFKLTVQVEDRECVGTSFELLVKSSDKIGDLKRRVCRLYEFPVKVQRWIIGDRIRKKEMTLYNCGVKGPTTICLYLLPAHSVGLRPEMKGTDELESDYVEMVNAEESMQFSQPPTPTILQTSMALDSHLPLPSTAEETADLVIGDRVVWPGEDGFEIGSIRWIGTLPDLESGEIIAGVEFDNPVGTGTGKYRNHRLFNCKHGHASLIPLMGLCRESVFQASK